MIRLLAVLLLTACGASPAPVPQGPLSLAERWELVALRNDFGHPLPRVARWEQPIKALGVDAGPYGPALMEQIALLGSLTGLSVSTDLRRTDPDGSVRFLERPNMLVTFASREKIDPIVARLAADLGSVRTGDFTCFVLLPPGEAHIYIRNDLTPEDIRACIVQETTQSLGLVGDLDGRTDSAFVSGNGTASLTPEDEAVIRLHYSPQLRDGMPARDAVAVVRQLAGR